MASQYSINIALIKNEEKIVLKELGVFIGYTIEI